MTQPAADLHVHTTASDGTLTVPELPAAARRAGVEWVAVTDHDRVHPDLDAPVTDRDGVHIIRGIELRVETDRQRLDLLGYGVSRPTRSSPSVIVSSRTGSTAPTRSSIASKPDSG
jgi:Predicted metal-dependent phosphoesterases (PHP family)